MASTTPVALIFRSSPMPTNETLPAVACRLVHLRVMSALEVIIARPNSTSVKDRPIAPLLSVPSAL